VKIFSLAKVLNKRNQSAPEAAQVTAENPVSEAVAGAARTKPFVGRETPSSAQSGRVSQLLPGEEQAEAEGRMEIDREPPSAELVTRTNDESRKKKKLSRKAPASVRHSADRHLQHVNAKVRLLNLASFPELYYFSMTLSFQVWVFISIVFLFNLSLQYRD